MSHKMHVLGQGPLQAPHYGALLAPGLSLHRIGVHTMGIRSVRVHTGIGESCFPGACGIG